MSRIAVLSSELANQIAAGEVVERPASVVKELVENSLDAEATRIDVEIEQGGLSLIRIVDNGVGMTPEEAELSLSRHATSKLREFSDLSVLSTLGFRGEALPSIAGVSKFTLTTRPKERMAGVQLQGSEGAIVSRAVGAAVGTQIEVRDLFYNVPARLKFMKAASTETSHVTEMMVRLALAFPAVHFSLRQQGRTILELPSHQTLLDRAEAIFNPKGKGVALYGANSDFQDIHVEACIGDPHETTSTARNVYLLVNGRVIRDRSLLHAAVTGYGEQLEKGRYPTLVVHVQMKGDDLDVNVHPQKLEVRFKEPSLVYSAVRSTVQQLSLRAPWVTQGLTPSSLPYAQESRPEYAASMGTELRKNIDSDLTPQSVQYSLVGSQDTAVSEVKFFSSMQYLGQIHKTYLLCEHQGQLVIIDQHAAHERLAYERLRRVGRMPRVQRLLLPVVIDLGHKRAALVEQEKSTMENMGFELRSLGGSSWAVLSVPDAADFGRGARVYSDPQKLFESIVDELEEVGQSKVLDERKDKILATIACHSVVRAGDVLDSQAARSLLAAMDEVEFYPHCPHGRPVLVRMDRAELEKRFGR